MNNKEVYFEEKARKEKADREAFIVSKVTRKLMTISNDISTNNHDIHIINHHNHNDDNNNHKYRRLELVLCKILEYFDTFDTQIFVDIFIESEGILTLKKITEMNPMNKMLISIVSAIDILIKLTRYDNDIRVMIYNQGFVTILTHLIGSTTNNILHERGALLFSELSVLTPDVFLTSSIMTVHNHSIYYSNETDYGYDHDENRKKGESSSLIPKSILHLFRAPSLEVKRAAITLCLTLWSSNPKAVENLKEDDSRGKWLYRAIPHVFRVLLNQQKDENNRVELVTLSRHESAELIVYFYSDPLLQAEVLRYLVSLILLQTHDSDTPNFIKGVLEAHDHHNQVQSLSNELDNDDNTISKILDTTIVMTCNIFRRILQLSEEQIIENHNIQLENKAKEDIDKATIRSTSPSKISSPRSPRSPRTPSKSLSPRSQINSTKSTLKKDSTSTPNNTPFNKPLLPSEDKNTITISTEKTNQYPSYSKLAIEDALHPLRESKLHLAFFCLILTIIYNFNNKTWRNGDNILKDDVVSRLIDSLQLWLWVDSDSNFDIKKFFIIHNIPIIDFGPIECIDLASSLEEVIMCDQATTLQIIELLKEDIGFKDCMKDLKRNIYDSIHHEHNEDVFHDDDDDDDGKHKNHTNGQLDSKIKQKVLKPTGYRVLMKALGLNNNVMENKMEVSGIDENKMMKLVSTIRPADIKKRQPIINSGSPKGSPERKAFRGKSENVDLEDTEDQPSPIKSPKASPKASPTNTFKIPNPNQSVDTHHDDDEMLEKMTNIEKIMYKIQSQLEIVDLYTNHGKDEEEDENFLMINTSNNTNTKPLTPKLGLRHKITLPDAVLPDAVPTTPISSSNNGTIKKKKQDAKTPTSETLFMLCDQKFA